MPKKVTPDVSVGTGTPPKLFIGMDIHNLSRILAGESLGNCTSRRTSLLVQLRLCHLMQMA